mmetsp:Transcript_2718/g.10966  ORF Transcript_2718/g.10966 Transcript_2718/m.10966 type:complete len:203 (+) Transcript_2718:123-731(+)
MVRCGSLPRSAAPLLAGPSRASSRGHVSQASARQRVGLPPARARGRCPGRCHARAHAAGAGPGTLASAGPPRACRDAWPATDMPGGRVSRLSVAPFGWGRGGGCRDVCAARCARGAEGSWPRRDCRHRPCAWQGRRNRRGPAPTRFPCSAVACPGRPRQPRSARQVLRSGRCRGIAARCHRRPRRCRGELRPCRRASGGSGG